MCSAQKIPLQVGSQDPCLPMPTSDSPFIYWDDTLLPTDWWNIAATAENLPEMFANLSADTCVSPAIPAPHAPGLGAFYWEPSCPYTINWLSKFDWYSYETQWVEKCYVLFPCLQNVSIANCTRKYCSYRCNGVFPESSPYSVCIENNLKEYRNIWVFCPITYFMIHGTYVGANCYDNPHDCLKQVTLRVPQCCECWSCWKHKI